MSNFESAPSWSVSYKGVPYDDARMVDGIWWYRSFVDGNIRRFSLQNEIVPLFENPPLPLEVERTHESPTVLAVGNEEGLDEIATLLRFDGYSVLSAEDSEAAARIVPIHSGPIHVLLVHGSANAADWPAILKHLRLDGIPIVHVVGKRDGAEAAQAVAEVRKCMPIQRGKRKAAGR